MKRGQAAMEFLMTYGWAILVVLAAIGALAYFGVLSHDRFLPNKCTVGPGFGCVEARVSPTSMIVVLKNNVGSDLDRFGVNVTAGDFSQFDSGANVCGDDDGDISSDGAIAAIAGEAGAAEGSQWWAETLWRNGQDITLLLGSGEGSNATDDHCAFSGSATIDFEITYRKAGENLMHNVQGNLKQRVE